jgi:uncharacterized tellurite resistance protein B-like protein|tara:strand:+ start:755 stop:1171 length:417 start_codon:yes stop_codon:yes gene_type:complete
MFDIFKKKENRVDIFIKITCLLVHAAKIDEIYTDKEREIIKKTILNLGIEKNEIEKILNEAENIESNSNQLLEFTREIKQLKQEDKIKIVESLWEIIYSDDQSDIYEANLMRRLTGLLYLDNKVVGNIKEKIIKNIKN